MGSRNWPLGIKFAVAMLVQAYGLVYAPRGGEISSWRQPVVHRQEGVVPIIDPSRRALCSVIMCSRVMLLVGRECGGCPPSRRCNVVDIANAQHAHKGSGASHWIAIRGI